MPALDFAFLADAAEAEPGRKFYVLGGGIDQLAGPSFPLFPRRRWGPVTGWMSG
jgi:hypothetical protein